MKIEVYPGTFDPITYGHIDELKGITPLIKLLLLRLITQIKIIFSLDERVKL